MHGARLTCSPLQVLWQTRPPGSECGAEQLLNPSTQILGLGTVCQIARSSARWSIALRMFATCRTPHTGCRGILVRAGNAALLRALTAGGKARNKSPRASRRLLCSKVTLSQILQSRRSGGEAIPRHRVRQPSGGQARSSERAGETAS